MPSADPKIDVTRSLDAHGQQPVKPRAEAEEPILPPLTILARGRLAAEILATYAEVRWRLRRADLAATTNALRGNGTDRWVEPGLRSYWQGIRLAKAVTRTLALLPTDTRCLMQSLVLTALLSRREIGSTLVVAVKPEPSFAAHAWVEHWDRPLLPQGEFGRLLEL